MKPYSYPVCCLLLFLFFVVAEITKELGRQPEIRKKCILAVLYMEIRISVTIPLSKVSKLLVVK